MSNLLQRKRQTEDSAPTDVAIIGMACMFPHAPDLAAYWNNIINRVDAITDPPPEAWDAERFFDPDSDANDRVYCKRGGYLGPLADFNPLAYGIMPVGLEGGEPDQWLALKVAYAALEDANYLERLQANTHERHRTAVILGKGTYLNHGNLNMVQHSVVVDQTLQIIQSLHPDYTDADLANLRRELKRNLPPFNTEAAPGLVPNIVAGRIANRLDLMGPTYTIDAACASSLIAVEAAMRELHANQCDLALVGGVHVTTPIPILTLFCQLNALSHRQQIRPFDALADGTILSEGLGIVVLKRRADAERDGDRIYAVIKGIGTSSDGRAMSVLAPRLDGQLLALQRAYEVAEIDPSTVGLIEAHGTGTQAGDRTEVQALAALLGPRAGDIARVALGTVKSMIGHTMPAAGIAGLIKAALALHQRVLPPTINCDAPDQRLELDRTPLYINSETRPWIHGAATTPRRAGVSAFGFGGVNAHVVLEEAPDADELPAAVQLGDWDSEVVIIEGSSRAALVARLQELQQALARHSDADLLDLAYTINVEHTDAPYRIALVAHSHADMQHKLLQAISRLQDPMCKQIKDVKGIYFFETPFAPTGKLAFLFPGEGSQYANMLADLCIAFPAVRACFERIDRVYADHPRTYLPSDAVFPTPNKLPADAHQQLWQIDGAIESVLTANWAIWTLLSNLGIKPDAMVGHSTGEYSVLCASGIVPVSDQTFVEHLLQLNHMYAALAGQIDAPQAVLIAVGASCAVVETLLGEIDGQAYIGMDNCPHQTVVVGTGAMVDTLTSRLRERGLIFETLPFDRAYHSPLFAPHLPTLRDFLAQLPVAAATVRSYSCTTAALYPADADALRTVALEHWVSPVRFTETIEAMYADGVRIFVEVGARGSLSAFVDDTLRGEPHLAMAANVQHRSGIAQINHLVGILAAQHVPLDLHYLYQRRRPRLLDLSSAPQAAAPGTLKLKTGWVAMDVSPAMVAQISGAAVLEAVVGAPHAGVAAAALRNGHSTMVAPALHAASLPHTGNGHAPLVPLPERHSASNGNRSQASAGRVMQAHLHVMEQFLASQQDIMQQYLARSHGTLATAIPALPMHTTVPARQLEQLEQPTPPSPISAPLPNESLALRLMPQVQQILLDVISQRTGYPVEMLNLSADLEADLGIDSIKRVEILGAFRRETGLVDLVDLDRITSLKTLREIVDALEANSAGGTPTVRESAHPFIREVRSMTPGQELIALCELSVDDDLFLRDHTLGRAISSEYPELIALPIVPLTISVEMMAEAAVQLFPDLRVLEIRTIRARRWILVEQLRLRLLLVAHLRDGTANEVDVFLHEADDEDRAQNQLPIIECTVRLGRDYAALPAPLALEIDTPSRWTGETLYRDGMFHGPAFRAVASVERSGSGGAVATFQALPTDGLLRGLPDPQFVAEPVILDAAGQLVGFWTVEQLPTGFVVFPYRCEAIQFYGPAFRTPERLQCVAQIELTDDNHTRADIDLIDADGAVRIRLTGWEDTRFDMPRSFYRFMLAPRSFMVGEAWHTAFSTAHDLQGCKVAGFSSTFFSAHGEFWSNVLAHLILGPNERSTWRALRGPPKRRIEWLLGRAAAKDAVRMLVQRRCGLELCPADVEVVADLHGQPTVRGDWTRTLSAPVVLSISHIEGVAVAIAGDGPTGIGIDIEPIQRQDQGFADLAFTSAELSMLMALAQSEGGDWPLRCWCAKEALGKALGSGLAGGPHSVVVQDIDVQTGSVRLRLAGALAVRFPHLADMQLTVETARDGALVVAGAIGVYSDG